MSETTQAQGTHFYEALYADPAVAECSVLASKIYERYHTLLSSGEKPAGEYVIALPEGWASCSPQKMKFIGQASLSDLVLAECGYEDGSTSTQLFARYRGNVLINLAYIAERVPGPCHFIQFPGEVQTMEDDVVFTPLDEAVRRPLLTDMLAQGKFEFLEEGWGKRIGNNNPGVEAFYECMLCPEKSLPEAQQELAQHIFPLTKGRAVDAAYATLIGRCTGPVYKCLDQSTPAMRGVYNHALRLLTKDPYFELKDHGLAYNNDIKKFVLKILGSTKENNSTPALDSYVSRRFKEVIGIDYDALHEEVMQAIFAAGDVRLSRVIKDGYKTANGITADIEYFLTLEQHSDNSLRKRLSLAAKITTMKNSLPTPCGDFIADKTGKLQRITSSGEMVDLEPAQLQELNDILKNGVVIARNPGEPPDDSPKRKRWIRRSK